MFRILGEGLEADHVKNSAMEAENHVKCGASSKSLMNRVNLFRKLFVVILFAALCSTAVVMAQNEISLEFADDVFIEEQLAFMEEIIKLHDEIKNIHKSLEKLYPISVINSGHFFIFDLNDAGSKYEFKLKVASPMPIPDDMSILAAFPLEFYDMKPSAVISKDILKVPENYIFIFHEFVHCYQWDNGEQEIRKGLTVEKQEMAKNNHSWELNFPFPYNSEYFINKTMELTGSFTLENAVQYHESMKSYLQEIEFEYMIWQQWKEGFARYVENLVRNKIGLKLNTTIVTTPLDRVCFYEIGSKYIELLMNKNSELDNDIVELFYKMKMN